MKDLKWSFSPGIFILVSSPFLIINASIYKEFLSV